MIDMVEKKKRSSSKAKQVSLRRRLPASPLLDSACIQLVSGQKTLFDLFPRRLDPPKETKDLQRRTEHPRIDGDSDSSIGLPQASSSKMTLDIYANNGQHDRCERFSSFLLPGNIQSYATSQTTPSFI